LGAKKRTSSRKGKVKIVKKLARKTRVPPTKVHDSRVRPRRKRRSVEEHLKEEGWEE